MWSQISRFIIRVIENGEEIALQRIDPYHYS